MNETRFDINEAFAQFEEKIDEDICSAQDNEVRGVWEVQGAIDSKKIHELIESNIERDETGKIIPANFMVCIRNPHYYKTLVEKAWDETLYMHFKYGPEELEKDIELSVAEEQLHAVPAWGQDEIRDMCFGVAFLYDVNTKKPYVQPFFAWTDVSEDKKVSLEILENPHRILNEELGNLDKQTLGHLQ